MSGGGIRQWTRQRKIKYVEGGGEDGEGEGFIKRAIGWERKAMTNYCRSRGRKLEGIGRC